MKSSDVLLLFPGFKTDSSSLFPNLFCYISIGLCATHTVNVGIAYFTVYRHYIIPHHLFTLNLNPLIFSYTFNFLVVVLLGWQCRTVILLLGIHFHEEYQTLKKTIYLLDFQLCFHCPCYTASESMITTRTFSPFWSPTFPLYLSIAMGKVFLYLMIWVYCCSFCSLGIEIQFHPWLAKASPWVIIEMREDALGLL